MVMVTCQHTGIEFEAASTRSKNHPEIAKILDECAKDKHNPGRYAATKAALVEARKIGMNDIKEVVAFVNDVVARGMDIARSERIAVAKQKAADEQAKKERQQARSETNSILYKNGYRWKKMTEEDADYYAGFQDDPRIDTWTLYAPDGRTVTVAQALEEIRNNQ